MKQLWAPWRIQYIKQSNQKEKKNKRKECFLCLRKIDGDSQNLVLKRGKYAFVIMNRFPYNAGHLLIAPYRHTGVLESIKPIEAQEMFDLLQRCIRGLKKLYRPDGFNIGLNLGLVAGAGAPDHLHIHLIPRWCGDTNFMPLISDIKVINQELQTMYQELKKVIN
ncbi:MAG: HIT domain-containing protein [candidate division WOR-3 bacterium]